MRRADHVVHGQQGIVDVAERFLFIDIDGRHAGPAGAEGIDQRVRLNQRRAAGVDQQRRGFHAREVFCLDDAARGIDQAHVQRKHVASFEEIHFRACGFVSVGTRFRHGRLARPHQHVHAERLAVAGDDGADLPFAGFQRRHLLRNGAHRRQDQAPGEFGGRVRRRISVLARRHDDTEPGAGIDIDMRKDAALADQF